MPLAIADVLSGMPAAALARARVAGAAQRIFDVIDAPDPVPAGAGPPPTSRPRGAAPHQCRARETSPWPSPGSAARYPRAEADAVERGRPGPAPRAADRAGGPERVGQVHDRRGPAAPARPPRRQPTSWPAGTSATSARTGSARSIAAVDQQAHLFDTTIEENLRLANREASAEQMRAAVEGAQLDGWIDGLPAGLATRVGAHGSAVSGGQAQRIALARVLLADRPIVVLDEPGEHLDPDDGRPGHGSRAELHGGAVRGPDHPPDGPH